MRPRWKALGIMNTPWRNSWKNIIRTSNWKYWGSDKIRGFMSIWHSPFSIKYLDISKLRKPFCCNCWGESTRKLRAKYPFEGTLTFWSSGIPRQLNPNFWNASTSSFLARFTRTERLRQRQDSQPVSLEIRKAVTFPLRQALFSWLTMAYAVLMSLTRWTSRTKSQFTKPWSNRPFQLPRPESRRLFTRGQAF